MRSMAKMRKPTLEFHWCGYAIQEPEDRPMAKMHTGYKWRVHGAAVRCSSTEAATQSDHFTTHAPLRKSSHNPTRWTETLTKLNGHVESQKHQMEPQPTSLGTKKKIRIEPKSRWAYNEWIVRDRIRTAQGWALGIIAMQLEQSTFCNFQAIQLKSSIPVSVPSMAPKTLWPDG